MPKLRMPIPSATHEPIGWASPEVDVTTGSANTNMTITVFLVTAACRPQTRGGPGIWSPNKQITKNAEVNRDVQLNKLIMTTSRVLRFNTKEVTVQFHDLCSGGNPN
jgi:hypothetical protein